MGFYESVKCKTFKCQGWIVGDQIDTSQIGSGYTMTFSTLTGLHHCELCRKTHMYRLGDVQPRRWSDQP